jgi:cytochrome P450 monooxygenase
MANSTGFMADLPGLFTDIPGFVANIPSRVDFTSIPVILSSTVTVLAFTSFIKYVAERQQEKAMGFGHVPTLWQWDPFYGVDAFIAMLLALKNNRYVPWLDSLHAKMPKTFALTFLGGRQIWTIEPENLKTVANNLADFQVGPIRYNSKAGQPFAEKGIVGADGKDWEFARALVKPFFMREWYANTERMEPFAERFFAGIPADGETFDMFPHLRTWSLNLNLQFLFGDYSDIVTEEETNKTTDAFITGLTYARIRLLLHRVLWLFPWKTWYKVVGTIHSYVNKHIAKARAELKEREERISKGLPVGPERRDVCWHMVRELPNDDEVRSHLCLLFVPNNETTLIFLSNVMWNLARQPEIWERLRQEVKGKELNFNSLRSMKLLQNVLTEAHRITPVGLFIARAAVRDTTLPRGGGPKGDQPVRVRKGNIVQINKAVMYKDPDYWGDDALEFNPDRFDKMRPGLSLTPYNTGPRRCPGEMMTMNECGYMVARMAQTYKRLECRDPTPFVGVFRIGQLNKNGCQVAVYRE